MARSLNALLGLCGDQGVMLPEQESPVVPVLFASSPMSSGFRRSRHVVDVTEENLPMPSTPVSISLPIADRRTSFAFYRDGVGLEPFGEVADDGVPESLQFDLNDGVRIMLIPTGGFGWVLGANTVAPKGTSECFVSITVGTDAEVDEAIDLCEASGWEHMR